MALSEHQQESMLSSSVVKCAASLILTLDLFVFLVLFLLFVCFLFFCFFYIFYLNFFNLSFFLLAHIE